MATQSYDQAASPPTKRRKLSIDAESSITSSLHLLSQAQQQQMKMASEEEAEVQKEIKSGITTFVHPDLPGFFGVLKQRYTDFLVNEILPNGQVLHLKDLRAPKIAKTNKNVQQETASRQDRVTEAPVKPGSEGAAEEEKENQRSQDKAKAKAQINETDKSTLETLLGEDTTTAVCSLHNEVLQNPARKPKDFRKLTSNTIKDKDARTQVHQAMRRIFSSKFETVTSDDDTITITVASPALQGRGGGYHNNTAAPKGRPGWADLGGEYIHFTLYKENKDTMEVVAFCASQLKVAPRSFQFSGTKDRRAVSVQRCSAFRLKADQLAPLNRRLRGSRLGDFQHQKTGLELGDLGGNEFMITLRDCHFPGENGLGLQERVALAESVLSESVKSFKTGGFINYYGLQRFGSFATSTDTVGVKILKGDLGGAVSDILAFTSASLAAAEVNDPCTLISSDDRSRAEALNIWLKTHNTTAALNKLPSKFSAEKNIIMHLGRRREGNNPMTNLADYQGALLTIPRNLRLMYVHAYQSLVWNVIAGKRWELYGDKVVEGDLILVSEHETKAEKTVQPTVDDQGEEIVLPASTDRANQAGDFECGRALSATEAASGAYNIFDVVLPLPGWDVIYPKNAIGEEYKTFMASDRGGGLDPYDMRRPQKDFSLSGGYRKIMVRPGEGMNYQIKTYEQDNEQLVQTDLEKLVSEGKAEGFGPPRPKFAAEKVEEKMTNVDANKGDGAVKTEGQDGSDGPTEVKPELQVYEAKIAVILKMKLGSSQYATMALRELMKKGGVQTYKPDFGSGR